MDGASTPDADVPVDAGAPGWTAIEGLPEECVIEIADNPDGAWPPMDFEPCPGDSEECRQLVVDWDGEPPLRVRSAVGYHDGERGVLLASRITRDDFRLNGVLADDGRAIAVVRSPAETTQCNASAFDIREGKFAFVVFRAEDPWPVPIVAGNISNAAESARVLVSLTQEHTFTSFPSEIFVGNGGVVPQINPVQDLWFIDWDGALTRVAGFTPENRLASALMMHGDAVFYSSIGNVDDDARVAVGHSLGQSLVPAGDHDGTGGMATDGRTLVWYQGWTQRDILKYERLELWAAPYTTSAAELRPRRVAEADGLFMHTNLRVGFGYAVALAGDGERAVVYDLESGAKAELLSPPGTGWVTTFVGPEEVALAIEVDGVPYPARTVRYYRLDSLEFTSPE